MQFRERIYGRVSFCNGSFQDDSLLRPLSSRTEHSRIVVHHCRNSSVLSLLSALPALLQFPCVSSFSILCSSFELIVIFLPMTSIKKTKRRKNQNTWRYILSWCLLNHGLGLLQQNKKLFDSYFFNYLCNFLCT